jgi:DNA-binding NtrC family response regulator
LPRANNEKQITGGKSMTETLKGKRILIVDDEPDVLETLGELLDLCVIDFAPDFETAEKLLEEKSYDAAILDIMGVKGYDLLELARDKELPALMLTAHALSPEHLVKSIKGGAYSYIPKIEMVNIADYLNELLEAKIKNAQKPKKWFRKLSPFFDKKFGSDWQDKHKEVLREFNLTHTREELEKIL